MILSEAPLPYISAVSTRVTPSTMLVRKALPTSLRSYSLPYPQRSDVQLIRQTNCRLALQSVSSHTFASVLGLVRCVGGSWWDDPRSSQTHRFHPIGTIAKSRIDSEV